jgi:acetyltransferase
MAVRSSRSSDGGKLGKDFFEPRSLTVIGASTNADKVGHALLVNVVKSGYSGAVYPINPHATEIVGLTCYPDVASLPEVPDQAVIVVPAAAVPDVITQCVDKGVKYGVVISAGFREVGIEGRRIERELVERARKGGMRILGPNCLGIMNTSLPLNASFAKQMPPRGSIGVISQSGAICTSLIDWARSENVGFSKLVSLGNSADLHESDFVEALTADDETTVISMYLEGVTNGTRFLKALSSASEHKPAVVFKAGTTEAGARAASSHTGSLAGSESAYAAVCEQAPALRASSVEELVDLSRALASQQVPRGPRVAIVTNAGGPGIIASDACEKHGLVLASISGRSLEQLRKYLPAASSLHNPVDVLGDADAMRYAVAVETLHEDPGVDAVVVILTPQAMTEIYRTAHEIVRIAKRSTKTLVCSFMGAHSVADAVSRLQKAGIPNVQYPDRAVQVVAKMYERSLQTRRPRSRPVKYRVEKKKVDRLVKIYLERGKSQVDPEDCRSILDAYGIDFSPFRVASTFDQAQEFATEMGYPVVLKIVSPQILHKTDIGGVVLDIRGREELEEAFEDVMSRAHRHMPGAEIEGVGVQKMVPPGKELILGMFKDPQFGPMIMVGLGGIYVEAFQDVSFRIAPVNPAVTARMLRELKAFRLLEGLRGERPADVEKVEEVIMRVSQMALDHPQLAEMDINPLMVYNAGVGCTAVDVRMTLGGERA